MLTVRVKELARGHRPRAFSARSIVRLPFTTVAHLFPRAEQYEHNFKTANDPLIRLCPVVKRQRGRNGSRFGFRGWARKWRVFQCAGDFGAVAEAPQFGRATDDTGGTFCSTVSSPVPTLTPTGR